MDSIFHVYGLRLWANQPIPGLAAQAGDSQVDVQIHFGALPTGMSDSVAHECHPYKRGDSDEAGWLDAIPWPGAEHHGFRLRYDDGTVFLVDEHGSQIWAVWPDSLTLEDTAVYLLGAVLGFVLRLRGVTCLHASAFCVDGQVVALAGPSGAGKSTTAAAIAGRDLAVLTDDLLALEEQRGSVLAHAGCQRLRLRPEAVKLLYGAPDALPLLTPNWDRRYLDLRSGSDRQALPLSAIYLLDERREDAKTVAVEPIKASTALLGLLANAHNDIHLGARSRAREFGFLGRLAGRVPVKRVIGHAGSDSLSSLCEAIIDDFYSVRTTWSRRVG